MRSHPTRILLMILACGIILQSGAEAGTIEGSVWMSREIQTAAIRKPDPARVAMSQRGVTDAVVWIEQIPEKVEVKLSGQARKWFWRKAKVKPKPVPSIVQVAQTFHPRVLAVPAGASVEFRNADRVYHSTFSVSAAKRFDLGKYAPGKRDTVEFSKRGVINLHSDLYPEMFGFVVVTPNHAFSRPDSLGRFTLPKLPAGRYTVRAWHPQRGELKREVEVPRKGNAILELKF